MFDQITTLIAGYGKWSLIGSSLLSLLCILLFSMGYISSNTEQRLWIKVIDIVMMFVYLLMFFVYLLAGVYMGATLAAFIGDDYKNYGAAVGVCTGLAAFWGMLELKAYIQKKRAEKQKNKRREAIEALKRAKEVL